MQKNLLLMSSKLSCISKRMEPAQKEPNRNSLPFRTTSERQVRSTSETSIADAVNDWIRNGFWCLPRMPDCSLADCRTRTSEVTIKTISATKLSQIIPDLSHLRPAQTGASRRAQIQATCTAVSSGLCNPTTTSTVAASSQ